ncbi:helix-turn-helix transcriptional regulator [Gardnerella sp. DNF00622A]|uniref:helix-turn-helix domain-containing protein n=1 Tax=Gardnerella sp. DNF00622A TaxID=2749053 RepID=UPI003BAE520C
MDINEAMAKSISAERAAAGLTIKELAEKSTINERTLLRLLKSERNINVRHVALLAEVFDLKPHELVKQAEIYMQRELRKKMEQPEPSAHSESSASSDSDVSSVSSNNLDDDYVSHVADMIAADPSQFALMAHTDPNKFLESSTPRN